MLENRAQLPEEPQTVRDYIETPVLQRLVVARTRRFLNPLDSYDDLAFSASEQVLGRKAAKEAAHEAQRAHRQDPRKVRQAAIASAESGIKALSVVVEDDEMINQLNTANPFGETVDWTDLHAYATEPGPIRQSLNLIKFTLSTMERPDEDAQLVHNTELFSASVGLGQVVFIDQLVASSGEVPPKPVRRVKRDQIFYYGRNLLPEFGQEQIFDRLSAQKHVRQILKRSGILQ